LNLIKLPFNNKVPAYSEIIDLFKQNTVLATNKVSNVIINGIALGAIFAPFGILFLYGLFSVIILQFKSPESPK